MIAVINILFRTKSTYEYLDNKFEDELNSSCNIIFMITGALTGLATPELRPGETLQMFEGTALILHYVISLALGAFLGVLIGRYLITYILYGIGKLLKGKAEVIDSRVIAAYSSIPALLNVPLMIWFIFSDVIIEPGTLIYCLCEASFLLIGIWTMKILIQGLLFFNRYGFRKAVINISPFVIIGLWAFYFRNWYPVL